MIARLCWAGGNAGPPFLCNRYSFLSPLPYHTANGITVSAGIVKLRGDIRRARKQAVTARSRANSGRPPVASCDTFGDEANRANVEARTEKSWSL